MTTTKNILERNDDEPLEMLNDVLFSEYPESEQEYWEMAEHGFAMYYDLECHCSVCTSQD